MKPEMRQKLASEPFAEKIRKVTQLIRLAKTFPRRQHGGGIIYDDTHGVETEADLIASADAASKLTSKPPGTIEWE
jgi:hypothetical protein